MLKGSSVHIKDVNKSFGTFHVLKDINLDINKGEFFSLLGPSGCGKTTLLRLIAGFEEPDTGTIALENNPITHLPPNKRHVNTVFQSYALFPHLSVFENVAFPLRLKKMAESSINTSVMTYLQLVKLTEHTHKLPSQLSGGQRQRVAIARALINEPQVLLLDEPLSALDAKLRHQLLIELDKIHDEVGITFIYVTHDQSEALGVSDRIAIMNEGRILQVGCSRDIYEKPVDAFVASFIGETNLLEGKVSAISANGAMVETSAFGKLEIVPDKEIQLNESVQLSLRPEKIRVTKEAPPKSEGAYTLHGQVDEIVYSGFQSRIFVKTDNGLLLKTLQNHAVADLVSAQHQWKDPVHVWWKPADLYLIKS